MNTLDILYRINRWWLTNKVDEVFLFKAIRNEFNEVLEKLEERRITAILGPRRVGKSTILLQTINYLLQNKIDPKRILFFSGDEPGLLYSNREKLENLIEIYLLDVLHERIEQLTSKVFILIDEVHLVNDWQIYLKSYFDKKANIKFIISGSSASHLFYHSRESLLGRMDEIQVLPLNFKQFKKFYQTYKEKDLPQSAKNDTNQLQISLYDNPDMYYTYLKENYYVLLEDEAGTIKILNEYLLVGGYPEYFETSNTLLWQKRLREDIISKGLYRDIVSIYNVKNPEILEKLLFLIAANQGKDFAYSNLAKTLGVDTVTISSYLNYLAQAFLIIIQENYSANAGKIIRKNKKFYILDNGIRNALLKITNFDPAIEGQLIENCAIHNAKLYASKNNADIYYWRTDKKEVDAVIDRKDKLIPIEVKYRNTIEHSDLKGLHAFMTEYKCPYGLVITKKELSKEGAIISIPFWLSDRHE